MLPNLMLRPGTSKLVPNKVICWFTIPAVGLNWSPVAAKAGGISIGVGVGVSVGVGVGVGRAENTAVTEIFETILKLKGLIEPLAPPVHDVNSNPAFGTAVSRTLVPGRYPPS